jgi:hypothetical protein
MNPCVLLLVSCGPEISSRVASSADSCQYFLWYMVFLPVCLPTSSFLRRPFLGFTALGLWIAGQAVWLQQGYLLEFLGNSTFVPLWTASLTFFLINCWILGIMIRDGAAASGGGELRKARPANSRL